MHGAPVMSDGVLQQVYRFFAEDRASAAAWRSCDETVAQRARKVEEAHAAAKTSKEGNTRTAQAAKVGTGAQRRKGASAYGPLWRIWALLRPTWREILRGEA